MPPVEGSSLPARWAASCGLLLPVAALAQAAPPSLPAVVVTATRTDRDPFELPVSIDRVDGGDLRAGRPAINISEGLGSVPGLQARDRQNYAQDVQLSVRGFGARASFGIRGVRLYVDEVPATLPDGQGQISHVELGTVDRLEVLRGPFSALYGNSAGGVVQVFTQDPSPTPRVGVSASAGSDGTWRIGADASGTEQGLGYVVGASRFVTDGYRAHSAADRRLGNAKFTLQPDDDSRVVLVVNSVALPRAQDPLGLTRAQMEADPRAVDPSALAFDTRKTVEQTQAGLVYERRIADEHTLRLLAYGGHRGTEQYQAIPVAAQASPLSPGGVIVLSRDYGGADARWTWRTRAGDRPLDVVAGVAHDRLDEHRQGYRNFDGTTLGVRGELRREEDNTASNTDPYLQVSWQPAADWRLDAGVRHSRVSVRSTDRYVTAANPDDSGSVDYEATLPVLGVRYAVNDDLGLYATAGRGFETPTLNELAYRPGGQTGLNLALRPATSDSVEAGVKARLAGAGELGVAVFATRTDHEIATLTNTGGRATFQNAGRTRRTGLELGWNATWRESLSTSVAASWTDATYRDAFTTCTGSPCAAPNTPVAAGNRIPGVARSVVAAAAAWRPATGWRGGVEARWLGDVPVNDVNSDAAASYAIASAWGGWAAVFGGVTVEGFVRADNLFDRGYVGSVIVNEGNGRFFEPAPGRTWMAGVSASARF